MQPVQGIRRPCRRAGQFGQLGAGRGARRGAAEQCGRQRFGTTADQPVRLRREHLSGDVNLDPVDRSFGIEHRDAIAEAVDRVAQPNIAIDVDAPVNHGLVMRVARRQTQRLDQPLLRCAEAVAGLMVDREAHQINLNWRAIAASSCAFSRMKA